MNTIRILEIIQKRQRAFKHLRAAEQRTTEAREAYEEACAHENQCLEELGQANRELTTALDEEAS